MEVALGIARHSSFVREIMNEAEATAATDGCQATTQPTTGQESQQRADLKTDCEEVADLWAITPEWFIINTETIMSQFAHVTLFPQKPLESLNKMPYLNDFFLS